jgi:glycosyltransferase involved in cell wall biosynthesis
MDCLWDRGGIIKVISFVEGANPKRGGVGLVGVPYIARSTAEQGHQVALVVGGNVNPGWEAFVRSSAAEAQQFPCGKGGFGILVVPAFSAWAFSPRLLFQIWRDVQRADFVTLHSLYSFPVFIGFLLAEIFHKPYCLWPHGALLAVQQQISPKKKKAYEWLVGRRMIARAALLIYSSAGEREDAKSLGVAHRSVIIPHGFNPHEMDDLPARGLFRKKYFPNQTGPLILFLSRLNSKKGLDLLLRSFSLVVEQNPEVRLAIVGQADPLHFESEVRRWVDENHLGDRVVLTGLLTAEEKMQAFTDADVFVYPSEGENFGFAMFEAMASRIPVVVSDVLDYASEVKQKEAGLVVRREPKEFAGAILRLLRDPSLRETMGRHGRELTDQYSWEACGRSIDLAIQYITGGIALPEELKLAL